MTREEAKEMLPIIQAFAEGKTIQIFSRDGWSDIPELNFSFPANYRIKPEIKYRPFKTKEECWNEMHKHPDLGWVMNKSKEYLNITEVFTNGIKFIPFDIDGRHSMPEVHDFVQAFHFFTFTDEEPFGIKEE